jgi:hypothetical protein
MLLFLLSLILPYSYAQGGFYDGHRLYSALSYDTTRDSAINSENVGLLREYIQAYGYILGVFDALSGSFSSAGKQTNEQLKDVVLKYLREHPEQRRLNAASLVGQAYKEAFPLRSSSK